MRVARASFGPVGFRAMVEGFRTEVRRDGDEALVLLHGDLDMASAPQVVELVDAVCAWAERVRVDLRPLGFIDSSGFSALLRLHRRFGGTVEFVRPVGAAARAIEQSGLDRLIAFVEA